jgi:hypothetical protein
MLPTPKDWFQGFVTNWFCYQIIVAAVTIAAKELQKNNLRSRRSKITFAQLARTRAGALGVLTNDVTGL